LEIRENLVLWDQKELREPRESPVPMVSPESLEMTVIPDKMVTLVLKDLPALTDLRVLRVLREKPELLVPTETKETKEIREKLDKRGSLEFREKRENQVLMVLREKRVLTETANLMTSLLATVIPMFLSNILKN